MPEAPRVGNTRGVPERGGLRDLATAIYGPEAVGLPVNGFYIESAPSTPSSQIRPGGGAPFLVRKAWSCGGAD